jgi:hypothetical protein
MANGTSGCLLYVELPAPSAKSVSCGHRDTSTTSGHMGGCSGPARTRYVNHAAVDARKRTKARDVVPHQMAYQPLSQENARVVTLQESAQTVDWTPSTRNATKAAKKRQTAHAARNRRAREGIILMKPTTFQAQGRQQMLRPLRKQSPMSQSYRSDSHYTHSSCWPVLVRLFRLWVTRLQIWLAGTQCLLSQQAAFTA